MLGYHRAGQHRMVDCYGRDHQAPALRALCQVLSSVRDCSFKPDETRSGRFADDTSAAPNVGQSSGSVTEVVEPVAESSSDSSLPSGDETGSGTSADSGEPKDDLAEGSLVKHRKYGTLHRVLEIDPLVKAACGVTVDRQYDRAEMRLGGSWCKKCFKGRITQ